MSNEWSHLGTSSDGTLLGYGDRIYRVAPCGSVYTRYYRRYATPRNQRFGSMAERKIAPGNMLAIAAQHTARALQGGKK